MRVAFASRLAKLLQPGERVGMPAIERLIGEGIRMSGTVRPGVLRAVTHLGITDEDVERAVDGIPRALDIPVRVR